MSVNQFLKPFNWQTYPDDERTCLVKPGQGAIDYNLILTGRPTEVDEVIRLVGVPELNLTPIDSIVPGEWIGQNLLALVPALKAFEDIEIRLYNLEGDTTEQFVWQTIQKIYKIAADKGWIIFADPNLITVAPSTGGGSGGAVGGPLDKLGKKGTQDEFIQHWAFSAQGIGLEDGKSSRLVPAVTGKDVQVFIFDSLDRRIENEILLDPQLRIDSTMSSKPEIRREYPPDTLKLTISSPAARYHRDHFIRRPVRILSSNNDKLDVDEHGLFVAGILHRVAPECSIHLVDVLNREGRGESYGLIKALYLLVEQAATSSENSTSPPLEGVVVNLSLGTTLSEYYVNQKIHESLKDLRKAAYISPSTNHFLLSLLDDMVNHNYYIGSLRLIIKLLYELGAILVAAAGNDSDKVVGERLKQIPATYPEVIAVAASTFDGKKANFSNLGDIMAPGGGKPMPDVKSPSFDYEALQGDEYKQCSVMSIVPKIQSDDSGFAYWRGTSFSTPFVSGLIALMVQKLKARNGSLHPNHLRELLFQYARDGIINVLTILGQINGS